MQAKERKEKDLSVTTKQWGTVGFERADKRVVREAGLFLFSSQYFGLSSSVENNTFFAGETNVLKNRLG